MTYKLFLDDLREPPDNTWIVARTLYQLYAAVSKRGMPNQISFDHDLGETETGMDAVKWLCRVDMNNENDIYLRFPDDFTFTVHSSNPCGAENIRGYLNSYLSNR